VEMEVSPYDPTRGRIIWRHKWKLNQVLKKEGLTIKSSGEKVNCMLSTRKTLVINRGKVN
jgi:hypothetical protein